VQDTVAKTHRGARLAAARRKGKDSAEELLLRSGNQARRHKLVPAAGSLLQSSSALDLNVTQIAQMPYGQGAGAVSSRPFTLSAQSRPCRARQPSLHLSLVPWRRHTTHTRAQRGADPSLKFVTGDL